MSKTVTFLISEEEFNNYCDEFGLDDCGECVDNFEDWCREATRYVYYLTHFACSCNIYCDCVDRLAIQKEAVFWYIRNGQKTSYNEENSIRAKTDTYYFLLNNGLVIN